MVLKVDYPDFIEYNGYHKMKLSYLSIFALLAVAILLFTQAAAAQGPCDEADALREAKLYDEAKTEYIILLKNDMLRDCAQRGLQNLSQDRAKELLIIGQDYEKEGQIENAINSYREALKKDPNLKDAKTALESIKRNKIYIVKEILNDIYSFIVSFSKIPLESIVFFILFIFILIYTIPYRIIPYLFNLIGRVSHGHFWLRGKFYWIFGRPRLDISDFDKGTTNDDIGKALEPIVEEGINNFHKTETRPRFYLIDGSDKSDKFMRIPAGIKTIDNLKIISELIEWFFPQNVITLSGFLQKQTKLGAGLTLVLTDNRTGEIISNDTIWQDDFDPNITPSGDKDIPYYRLAELAAIWAIYQMENFIKPSERFTALGTADWKSYAYYQSGVRWMNEDKRDKARHQFARAINKDMGNLGALFNMGILDISEGQYERACQRLEQARWISENCEKDKQNRKENGSNFSRERIWYKVMYQLAATYLYKENFEKAEETVINLVNTINNTLNDLRIDETDLKEFLTSIIPQVNSFKAIILDDKLLINDCEHYIKEPKLSIFIKHNGIIPDMNLPNLYLVHYNLACYYSISGKKANLDKNKKIEYKKSIEHLEYAFEIEGRITKMANKDPFLDGVCNDDKTIIKKDETAKAAFDKLINKYTPKETPDPTCLT